ncbi:hypothetical protein [Rhizobium phaseoli]|uniref:Uncharacterized protein n=1 Tax=Rhizobium phaseoli TaxID=396 RepID=A0ABN4QNA8_9HYPH|nr:hypothetical protein [Rhizobium phaseoli]ANL87046.1 hypothetical protein AMC81_PA00022 [Rhizobium phaseoli]ANL93555.1 hypothetical protein AMC80_PA00022 [Rhizobium phaseoli]
MTALTGIVPDEEFEKLIDRGGPIGKEGGSRIAFAVQGRSDLVIKESYRPFHHGNFTEWTVWCALQTMAQDIMGTVPNGELRLQFAPCFAISHSARFVMMERLLPLDSRDPLEEFVKKLPSWLNDKKPSAIGKTAQGDMKVLDYGAVNFYEVLNPKNKTNGFDVPVIAV